ncbi:unnamed protein product, partial [Staurois parvus]
PQCLLDYPCPFGTYYLHGLPHHAPVILLVLTEPRTLHSLYLISHRPCIHYIRPPTVHRTWKCNYFSKYKMLNTFSDQQLEQSCDFYQCPALSKACRRSFLSAL